MNKFLLIAMFLVLALTLKSVRVHNTEPVQGGVTGDRAYDLQCWTKYCWGYISGKDGYYCWTGVNDNVYQYCKEDQDCTGNHCVV